MLKRENFTREHMETLLRENPSVDPLLLERMVFAFGLLEALKQAGTPFIFKGGTSLLLLLPEPHRLSTDIDILVEPGCDIVGFVEKTAAIFPFLGYSEQKRQSTGTLEKRHFRFDYRSLDGERIFRILLDVVFEPNPYPRLLSKEIANRFLPTTGTPSFISVPSVESILGDKLTAFAPHTVGIPFRVLRPDGSETEKRMEVAKQFFDVGQLISQAADFQEIRLAHDRVARLEIGFRGLDITPKDCLVDTFQCALSLLCHGAFSRENHSLLLDGIQRLRSHLFGIRFDGETAYKSGADIALLTAGMIRGIDVLRLRIPDQPLFRDVPNNRLNRLKKLDPETFNRTAFALRLMERPETL